MSEGGNHESEESRQPSRFGIHKWIFVAGAFVAIITIAYLENIVSQARQRKTPQQEKQRQQAKAETVYVTE